MFAVLTHANKVERRAEKLKILEEQKALEEPTKPEPPPMDEVKGRSWADVDSDDETPHAGGVGVVDTSSDEGEPDEEEEEEEVVAETESVSEAGKSNEPKPEAAPKQLSKKERAALKKQELNELDDVLAEFGVEVSAPTEQESKKKKKKAKDDGSKNNTPELSEVERVSASPEPSEPETKPEAGLEENVKEEALKKLAAKGKGKGKGGAKSEKKTGISTAAEEAKKRAKNAAKPKKDKNAFDR